MFSRPEEGALTPFEVEPVARHHYPETGHSKNGERSDSSRAAVDPGSIPGISDRLESFLQLGLLIPFFVTAWIANGFAIKDVSLFTNFFGSLLLGVLAHSAHLKKENFPFPGQLQQFVAVAAALLVFFAYNDTGDVEATVLLGSAVCLRILSAQVEIRTPRALFLVIASMVVSSTALAPLGAYVADKKVYLPFMLFGIVPALFLASAKVLQYSPMLEAEGWKRSFLKVKKDGTESTVPGGLSRLFVLLFILGPLIPASLVPFDLIPNSFMLTVLSLHRVPQIAEGFLRRSEVESKLYARVIQSAYIAAAIMFVAAEIA